MWQLLAGNIRQSFISPFAELEQLEHFLVVKLALVLQDHLDLCGLLVFHRPVELQASDICNVKYSNELKP